MLTALEQRGADETTSVLYEASPVVTPTVASLASSVASMGISSRMSRARLGMSDAEYQALLVALQDDNVQALRALLSKFVDEREEFKRTPGSAPVFHGGSPLQPLRLASAATSPRPRGTCWHMFRVDDDLLTCFIT